LFVPFTQSYYCSDFHGARPHSLSFSAHRPSCGPFLKPLNNSDLRFNPLRAVRSSPDPPFSCQLTGRPRTCRYLGSLFTVSCDPCPRFLENISRLCCFLPNSCFENRGFFFPLAHDLAFSYVPSSPFMQGSIDRSPLSFPDPPVFPF